MKWYYCVDEEGYFGQEQVPLTDEIKEILEEYPDGQIFKVHISVYLICVGVKFFYSGYVFLLWALSIK